MKFTGIDISISSTAVTVFDNGHFSFYSFPRVGTIKPKFKELLFEAGVTVMELDARTETDNISDRERSNLLDANTLACYIVSVIPEDVNDIIVEGLSFGSSGSSALTYAGYHYIIRNEILELLFKNVEVVSPSTIKKCAGKGNYKKEQMILAFLNDETFKNTKLQQTMLATPEKFQTPKSKKWLKPIDDIVDSLYAVKILLNRL